ncbi:hypothetical protein C8J57DRAFT_1532936 [Mycena rebaudengoi]|nr:hypothetical protein C8J57DRAFT_1532936 [Mycena rebaudengoi]
MRRNPHHPIQPPPGFHGRCREICHISQFSFSTTPPPRPQHVTAPARSRHARCLAPLSHMPARSRPRAPTHALPPARPPLFVAPIPGSAAAGTVRTVWRCVAPASPGFSRLTVTDNVSAHLAASRR